MNPRVLKPAFGALSGLLASLAVADAGALEQRLRAAHPDIERWQLRPMNERGVRPGQEILEVGRVGARTPVRYADGHLAWFSVAGFRTVLVSTRALEAQDTLGATDVTTAEADVIATGCEPQVALDPATRWRATRRLDRGAPLCARDVEPVPDIARDQTVRLTTRRGAIEVSRVLTAAADAQVGERVRLRDRSSGATVWAVVTAPGEARVDGQETR